jgi:hypothetical protein
MASAGDAVVSCAASRVRPGHGHGGDAALLGVAPHTDGASYVGLEAAGQHVGITNLFNRLNGTTRQAPAAATMIGRTPKGE